MLNSLATSIFWGRSHENENALAFQAVATYMIIATIFMTAGPKGERSDDKVGPKTLTDVVNATERITTNQVGPSSLSTEVQYDSRFTNTPRPSLHLPRYFITDLFYFSSLDYNNLNRYKSQYQPSLSRLPFSMSSYLHSYQGRRFY